MDKDQEQRFAEAVERKKEESEARSRATQERAPGGESGIDGDQESLTAASQPQDTASARDKSTRHKKVTADKWNQ